MTMKANVMSFDDARLLGTQATQELIDESEAAEHTSSGAVPAYEEGGIWHYCPPSEEDHMRRQLKVDVVTVYIDL
jgi:hypothetical protein